jgi:hypothetical protein
MAVLVGRLDEATRPDSFGCVRRVMTRWPTQSVPLFPTLGSATTLVVECQGHKFGATDRNPPGTTRNRRCKYPDSRDSKTAWELGFEISKGARRFACLARCCLSLRAVESSPFRRVPRRAPGFAVPLAQTSSQTGCALVDYGLSARPSDNPLSLALDDLVIAAPTVFIERRRGHHTVRAPPALTSMVVTSFIP